MQRCRDLFLCFLSCSFLPLVGFPYSLLFVTVRFGVLGAHRAAFSEYF